MIKKHKQMIWFQIISICSLFAFVNLEVKTYAAPSSELFVPEKLVKTTVAPAEVKKVSEGLWFVDFGKAAFGTVRFRASGEGTVIVHLGEVLKNGRIDREPGGSRRYRAMTVNLKGATQWYEVAITPDKRNTKRKAIAMPDYIGEVMPFRYCELEGLIGALEKEDIQQVRVHYPFNDDAASFTCSDPVLNDVWELCKYSIKATSFAGVYVDGDRERIPYEGDAYINQIAHYCLDAEYAMARRSIEYLMDHPTWPVEWHQHIPLMVWEELLYAGSTDFIEAYYNRIVAKMLQGLAREDGLLVVPKKTPETILQSINIKRDIRTLVDWPTGERDGHQIVAVDSVVNAFYYRNLVLMSRMASVIGKEGDSLRFKNAAKNVYQAYQTIFFDEESGLYRDGEGVQHSSLHANLFPLAFGLVSEDKQQKVLEFIESRGMACSVYGAQHLLDGLYRAGAGAYALSLLTSREERSWAHMIYDVGSTITLEAWDNKFKPNQDWNHAWGAAPANLIPRRLMGILPTSPGFKTVRIQPQIGSLEFAKIRHPTRLGPIELYVSQEDSTYQVAVSLPDGMTGELVLEGTTRTLRAGNATFNVMKTQTQD